MEELVIIEITCKKCGVIKPAEGNFSRSGQAATGYASVCWVCRKKDRDPDALLTCGRCGETKRAEGNYHRTTSYTGYTTVCKECLKVRQQACVQSKGLRRNPR